MGRTLKHKVLGFIFKNWYLVYVTVHGEIVTQAYRTEKEAVAVAASYAEIAHGFTFCYNVGYGRKTRDLPLNFNRSDITPLAQ
jgi:hypothetical protein